MFVLRPEESQLINNTLASIIGGPVSVRDSEYPSKYYVDKETGSFNCSILVPGFKSSDISASFENGTLTVSGYRSEKEGVWKSSFKKKFSVSQEFFDIASADFRVQDGVLKFSINKSGLNKEEIKFNIK